MTMAIYFDLPQIVCLTTCPSFDALENFQTATVSSEHCRILIAKSLLFSWAFSLDCSKNHLRQQSSSPKGICNSLWYIYGLRKETEIYVREHFIHRPPPRSAGSQTHLPSVASNSTRCWPVLTGGSLRLLLSDLRVGHVWSFPNIFLQTIKGRKIEKEVYWFWGPASPRGYCPSPCFYFVPIYRIWYLSGPWQCIAGWRVLDLMIVSCGGLWIHFNLSGIHLVKTPK